jgi:Ca2+-binding RTX toxin-like protein
MRTLARGAVVAFLAAATVLVVAAPAQAAVGGTVNVPIDGNLLFAGQAGFANTIVVTKTGTTVELDDVHTITPNGACSHPNPADDTYVSCTVSNSPDLRIEPGDFSDTVTISGTGGKWLVNLADGNDTANMTGAGGSGNTVVGGNGNDVFVSGPAHEWYRGNAGTDTVSYAPRGAGSPVTADLDAGSGGDGGDEDTYEDVENLVGTAGDDDLTGGDGNNKLEGRDGDDTLHGGSGNDTLIGGTGDDVLDGDGGTDTASYLGHPSAVTADLDGVQDDGAAGEDDWIQSTVENLAGSSHGDTLTGDGNANTIHGDACSLLCDGSSGGDDTILGGSGDDYLYGWGGDDYAHGQGGADVISGSSGEDDLYGGSSADTISGGNNDDNLNGGSSYDALDGGSGIADWCDTSADGGTKSGCEYPLVVVWP